MNTEQVLMKTCRLAFTQSILTYFFFAALLCCRVLAMKVSQLTRTIEVFVEHHWRPGQIHAEIDRKPSTRLRWGGTMTFVQKNLCSDGVHYVRQSECCSLQTMAHELEINWAGYLCAGLVELTCRGTAWPPHQSTRP